LNHLDEFDDVMAFMSELSTKDPKTITHQMVLENTRVAHYHLDAMLNELTTRLDLMNELEDLREENKRLKLLVV